MYEPILESTGLSKNEAKIYETLILLGESSAPRLSIKSGIHRRNVYDSCDKLVEKGLATTIHVGGKLFFKPVNPDRLISILKEKENTLNTILPELKSRFKVLQTNEQAMVYKGIESAKNIYQDMIEVGETFYCIGGRGNWLDPRWKYFFPQFDKQRLAKGIEYCHLFYNELKDPKHPNHEITKLRKNKYRFLPKGFTSTCSIEIWGDRVASMYWADEPLIVLTISKEIAEGYKKYFWLMWEASEKA
ncbi:MAG: helix-turn-helix domain-containing protein [Candidatus Micrarchaeia archaeon]